MQDTKKGKSPKKLMMGLGPEEKKLFACWEGGMEGLFRQGMEEKGEQGTQARRF